MLLDHARRRHRSFSREITMGILATIGNASLVRLRKVVPPGCADIFVKLESENATGSLKDRMAHAVILRAQEDGRLQPGDTVVEYTGGSTGTSLAWMCAVHGYRLHIVSSDAFSAEKRDHMAALIEAARELARQPHTYWTDQLNNHDSIAGYTSLGDEIWRQTGGHIDAFVHCVGTGASLRGVATVLKHHNPRIEIIAVEPAESSVLLGGPAGPHKIEGVGIGYIPPSGTRPWSTASCRSRPTMRRT
jgi:cysteine synthase A